MFLSVVALAAAAAKFEFLEEWEMWKEQHGKGYQSEREELERHLVWLSNKKYIDQHNVNADFFGFTLAMNHFGDLVSLLNIYSHDLLHMFTQKVIKCMNSLHIMHALGGQACIVQCME